MKKVACHNPGNTFMHVGTVSIAPGATREVDPTLLDDYAATPAEPVDSPDTSVIDQLAGTVVQIKALLPTLTADQLTELDDAEQSDDGKKRQGVLSAIQEERLSRAATAELDAFRSEVRTILSEDELMTLAEQHEDDEPRMAIIQEQLDTLSNPGSDDGKQGPQ